MRNFSLSRPLPIPLPIAANWRRHRVAQGAVNEFLGSFAPVIFAPCSVSRILVKVLRGNMMVLARHHAAQAGEIAFNPVGVLAVAFGIAFRVIDALRWVAAFQNIPVRRRVSEQVGFGGENRRGDGDAFRFVRAHEGQCAAKALTKGHDNAARARLVLLKAAVDAVSLFVFRADVTAKVCAINFNFIIKRCNDWCV
jgi:hypothetical protein